MKCCGYPADCRNLPQAAAKVILDVIRWVDIYRGMNSCGYPADPAEIRCNPALYSRFSAVESYSLVPVEEIAFKKK